LIAVLRVCPQCKMDTGRYNLAMCFRGISWKGLQNVK
jgi:hypothetical protein